MTMRARDKQVTFIPPFVLKRPKGGSLAAGIYGMMFPKDGIVRRLVKIVIQNI